MYESTVWVLGAGFSQPLGAPLFRQLFQNHHRINTVCEGSPVRPDLIRVLNYYQRHAPVEPGRMGDGQGPLWQDPEDFLDVLESAATNAETSTAKILKKLGMQPPQDIADAARRVLAIECSQFLRGANPLTERWTPYREWACSLTDADTVITFNYDRVCELLTGKPVDGRLSIMVPTEGENDDVGVARRGKRAPVLKLHGSVDWVLKDGKIVADSTDGLAVSCAKGTDLVLGIPGPGKEALSNQYPGFRSLWDQAEEKLKVTERIVFVGYRFPPTDAYARKTLLTAIKDNSTNLKKVQVVLGPKTNHEDVVRMQKLLGWVCPPKRIPNGDSAELVPIVEVVPLYAQDFLAFPNWT